MNRWVLFAALVCCPLSPVLAKDDVPSAIVDTSHTAIEWSERLRTLVESHPSAEVREELHWWIIRGDVFLNIETLSSIVGKQDASVSFVYVEEYQVLVPLLTISPEVLEGPEEYAFLVLIHETVILQKLASGEISPEQLMLRPEGEPISAEEVITLFEVQSDAYLAECNLAATLGVEGSGFCDELQNGGYVAFRRAIAEAFSESEMLAPFRDLLLDRASHPVSFGGLRVD